jgi:hypothetical protein
VRKTAALLALFPLALFGAEDARVPLGDGDVAFRDILFTRDQFNVPSLEFSADNRTSTVWSEVSVQIDVGELCSGTPRQVVLEASFSLGRPGGPQGTAKYTKWVPRDSQLPPGCTADLFVVRLVKATNADGHTDVVPPRPATDLTDQLKEIQVRHEEEEKEDAANQARIDAAQEEQDRKDAVARAKRENQLKKEREAASVRDAAERRAREARQATERARLRVLCGESIKRPSIGRLPTLR